MVTISLNLSGSTNYKFTDPVRKYKANDPYYYEVDNIPINQLEENILWIKDAVENISIELPDDGGVSVGASRETFTELQPFVSGTNSNTVSVRPGRFMARINDAYGLDPLQIIQRTGEVTFDKYKEWQIAAINNTLLAPTLSRFQQYTANAALGMNGLSEKSFGSFIFKDLTTSGVTSTASNGTDPLKSNFGLDSEDEFTLPKFLWGGSPVGEFRFNQAESAGPSLKVSQYKSGNNPDSGFFDLFKSDTQLIKRWRGIARTAVVDVPQVLSIDIQNFEPDDFSYTDALGSVVDSSNGASPAALATQRIDLLFIYSKPIDASAVNLAQGWSSEVPRKIYKAELGIVKGAGLTLDYSEGINPTSKFFVPDYENQILANPSDELNQNLGFKTLGIRGSFPSPDDLMNMAPALADWLPNNHYALVGQSILPIAYIVVKKNNLNEEGNQIIEPEDIIDIRPFFRTTELTYGERAGLAAAVPAPSLANPVATESVVYDKVSEAYKKSKQYTDVEISRIRNQSVKTRHGAGKIISRGLIRGGNWFGPEGALCRAIKIKYNLDKEETVSAFKSIYNYGSDFELKNLPDWDLANWAVSNRNDGYFGQGTQGYPSVGYGITDRISVWYGSPNPNQQKIYEQFNPTQNTELDFGPFQYNPSVSNRTSNPSLFGVANMHIWEYRRPITMWIQKTIRLDVTYTPWVNEVTISADFWNCFPIQNRSLHRNHADFTAGGTLHVSKGKRYNVITSGGTRTFIEFTIFCNMGPTVDSWALRPPWTREKRQYLSETGAANEAGRTNSGYNLFGVASHALLFNSYVDSSIVASQFGESINTKKVIPSGDTQAVSETGTGNLNNIINAENYPSTALPMCIYPSVEFTVFGHPKTATFEVDSSNNKIFRNFANSIHEVPGIQNHEGVEPQEIGENAPEMKNHAVLMAFDDNVEDIPNDDTRLS